MNKTPFPFLDRKINILLVDDEIDLLDIFEEYFNTYPLYNVSAASNTAMAEKQILESGKRWHGCLLDLGMTTPDSDELYLLRKYGTAIPFIIVSGAHSIEKGLRASRLGALDAIDKPFTSLTMQDVIDIINNAILRGLFLYKKTNNGRNEIVDKAIGILFSNDISAISEWSFKSCMSESNHRKIWNEVFGIPPKKMFCIYRMLKIAFDFHNKAFEASGKEKPDNTSKFTNEIINLHWFYNENKQFVSQYFS